MPFWIGLIIGLMIGCIIGLVAIIAMMFLAKGASDIIADLCQALEEWVDINEVAWMAPDFGEKRFEKSCKALNKSRGLNNG